MKNVLTCIVLSLLTAAQLWGAPSDPGPGTNTGPLYQQLRNAAVSNEAVSVANFVLQRDAAKFNLRSGTVYFVAPVNGKVTGAVFVGDGSMFLDPPTDIERKSLSQLTGSNEFSEQFNELVFRFTDNTYEEIKSHGTPAASAQPQSAESLLNEINGQLRTKLKENIHARLLADVISPRPGGFFAAFIKGKRYSDKMLFEIDPNGIADVAPEEEMLMTWAETKNGIWAAFHRSAEYASGAASSTQRNATIRASHYDLKTQIERSGKLNGDAAVTFTALQDGVQVVPFDLFPSLRVSSVADATGAQLNFIQEDKNEDSDFWVILAKPLAHGESATIEVHNGGKDAVRNEGGDNFYPVARDDWYPATRRGDYATYHMVFEVPKHMTLVATGDLVKESESDDQQVSEWKSAAPQITAGFNLGRFKEEKGKADKSGMVVEAYANEKQPDWVNSIEQISELNEIANGPHSSPAASPQMALGSMNTTVLMHDAAAEGEAAMGLFTQYFGQPSYHSVAMTQQTACDYGQSWPGLVYLPICYFFDATVRHQLGLDDTRGYWQVVAPHEVAHQWWGHTVGWESYRDQWMSEGFADASAAIYLQAMYQKSNRFNQFWKDEYELLTEKNAEGKRPIDVGPLTLGFRLTNSKAGFDIYRRLVYPKGAYILHMLRMMMWTPTNRDKDFIAMMQDFVNTYRNQPASTEDFKAIVEKHMTPDMDLDGNHRMDWFFNEYVYGTQLPAYACSYSFSAGPNGDQVLEFKLTQGNVNQNFEMLVPVYLELANGNVVRMGSIRARGNATLSQKVPLSGVKAAPRAFVPAYFHDVLGTFQ